MQKLLTKYLSIILSSTTILFLFNYCKSTYNVTSEGENLKSLTQVTEDKRISFAPTGGDNGKNLVFVNQNKAGHYNIFYKKDVDAKGIIQKTSGHNINLAPDYSSKDKKIVFQHSDGSDFDIFYLNLLEGKAINQVTNSIDNEYNPCWGPNEEIIIFEKGAPPRTYSIRETSEFRYKGAQVKNNQLLIKNLKTGKLKVLGQGSFPAISPNGEKIAFVKYKLNSNNNFFGNHQLGTIWIMNIDGTSQKQITSTTLGYASRPRWSPDGEKIVFQLIKDNNSDIYTIRKDGSDLKQHTKNPSNDFSPYWAEGGSIYFSSDRGGLEGNYKIWRFNVR